MGWGKGGWGEVEWGAMGWGVVGWNRADWRGIVWECGEWGVEAKEGAFLFANHREKLCARQAHGHEAVGASRARRRDHKELQRVLSVASSE